MYPHDISSLPSSSNLTSASSSATRLASYYSAIIPVLLLFCFAAFLGNLALLACIPWIRRRAMTVNLRLSLSLAGADAWAALLILCGLVVNSYLPVVHRVRLGPWTACYFLVFELLRLAGLITSVLHLLLLAVNHWTSIVAPLKYKTLITSRVCRVCIAVVWVLPLLTMFTYGFSLPGEGFRNSHCAYMFYYRFRFRFVLFLQFACPFVLTLVIYGDILRRLAVVRRQRTSNMDDGAVETQQVGFGMGWDGGSQAANPMMNRPTGRGRSGSLGLSVRDSGPTALLRNRIDRTASLLGRDRRPSAGRDGASKDPNGCPASPGGRSAFLNHAHLLTKEDSFKILDPRDRQLSTRAPFLRVNSGGSTISSLSSGSCGGHGKTKALFTTLLIVGTFALGWLPALVVFLSICNDCSIESYRPDTSVLAVQVVVNSLMLTKLLINPFIYGFRMLDVRYALWAMRCSRFGTRPLPLRNVPHRFVRLVSQNPRS